MRLEIMSLTIHGEAKKTQKNARFLKSAKNAIFHEKEGEFGGRFLTDFQKMRDDFRAAKNGRPSRFLPKNSCFLKKLKKTQKTVP